MRFDREPTRSPSRSPPPFHDDTDNNDVDDETELQASIAEKETEMTHTQELLNEQMRQAEVTLTQLRQLTNISFNMTSANITCQILVLGSTGSGRTTLIKTILDENNVHETISGTKYMSK
ncbi:unnamed protein product [Rotaria sordida]|uniref:Uncharacterized protein n=1 Tax=Rotaria sordida TaxID=392033 RepID=A0A815B7G6_9BILA|nr:unnamed protein product [Rotaria sordida]